MSTMLSSASAHAWYELEKTGIDVLVMATVQIVTIE